jgi:flagellar motor protein MotB
VEIDDKTGKVKLHFDESYFSRGSHKLSEEMKDFLRIMIPKYAKAIYGNKEAAEQVKSLKITGLTSPVYRGVYIDVNDKSPKTEKARRYNMVLSNRRAKAMYDFIFDEDEMGDYEFRSRLKADMSIEALGFKQATPVPEELVGKPAKCIEYDCQQQRATVLQFRVFSE